MRRESKSSLNIWGGGLSKLGRCLLGIVLLASLSPTSMVARQSDQSPNPSQPPPAAGQPDQPAKPPKPDKRKNQDDQPAVISHWLRIEVVAAEDKKPIEDASVYVKFTEIHKVGKDKQMEFDLKTNQEGVARAPDVPLGKVEIQIVAPKWKLFGQFYEIDRQDQTIHIELVRPPRWY
jgi:hypothetical protein